MTDINYTKIKEPLTAVSGAWLAITLFIAIPALLTQWALEGLDAEAAASLFAGIALGVSVTLVALVILSRVTPAIIRWFTDTLFS